MKTPASPVLALLGAVLLLTSGCVSSKYKMAGGAIPPAPTLNLSGDHSTLGIQADSVIVFHGPGSWKRDAYWDEYGVTVTNRGKVPVVIESATLTDFQGNANPPGVDPWKLEAESKTWWENTKSSQTGQLLVLGASAAGISSTLLLAAIAADGGLLMPATTAGSALAGAAIITAAAAPVYAVTVIVINSKNKNKVVAEFQRRRLALPLNLAPGATAQGSFFFRISPAPSRLAVRYRAGDETSDAIVDLAPLGSLHLKPAAPAGPATDSHASTP